MPKLEVAARWIALAALVLGGESAHAAGLDGLSAPSWGGGWVGPGDPGARGVLYNPTAAGTGEAPELLIDLGVLGVQVGYWPDTNEEPLLVRLPVPHPTFTAAIPIGKRFGFGTYLNAPYVRSDFTTGFSFIESALLVSFRANDWLTVAGGLRLGWSRVGATIPLDTGALVNASVNLDEGLQLPEEDPFLLGDQLVPTRNRFTASPVVAATVETRSGVAVHGVFRPPWVVRNRSTVALRPSNDLAALLDGDVVVRVPLPLRATLAATIPVGRVTLLPELEFVGWRAASRLGIELSNLRIVSSDPVFNEVLASVGLAEADFLAVAEGPQSFDLQWRNVFQPALQAEWKASERVDVRGGVLLTNSAVSPAVLDAFNIDFASLELRAGAAVRTSRTVRLSGTAAYYVSPARIVRGPNDRITSFYDLNLWRIGFTSQFFFGTRRGHEPPPR
ncbi:MAG: hypothetical protein AAGA48_17630 [Myxococcota bacterium]